MSVAVLMQTDAKPVDEEGIQKVNTDTRLNSNQAK